LVHFFLELSNPLWRASKSLRIFLHWLFRVNQTGIHSAHWSRMIFPANGPARQFQLCPLGTNGMNANAKGIS
jgi:hypothetical protein